MKITGEGTGGLCRVAVLVLTTAAIGLAPGTALGASILPTTTADESTNNATCSLREAVQSANTNTNLDEDACASGDPGPTLDLISLGAGQTYLLAGASAENDNASGDFDVEAGAPGPLEIAGQGLASTTIDANDNDRAIHLETGNLTVSALRIEDSGAPAGNHPGGAIFAAGTGSLTLSAVQLTGNATPEEGGAIATSSGAAGLVVNDSIIGPSNLAGGTGGGIDAEAPLTMTNTTVDLNRAEAGDGGGLSLTKASTITNSAITNNNTNADVPSDDGDFGGGIEFNPGAAATLTITGGTISDNAAELRGAGVYVGDSGTISMSGSTVSGNDISNDTEVNETGGAGVALDGAGASTIATSTVADNTSTTDEAVDHHGGILNDGGGPLTVRRSTVEGNSVTGGSAQHGGGISNDVGGTLTLVNSTIAGNSVPIATGLGGGLDNDATATIISSTFQGNDAMDGHAINDQGATTLGNSIVFDSNTTDTCTGPPTSTGNNVAVGTSCVDGATSGSDASDLPSTSAALQALASNGGPTQTHAILASSPAFDHVPTGECLDESAAALTVDQRGAARPIGSGCDSGAFERQSAAPAAPTVTDSDPDSPADENNPEIKGSAAGGSTVTLYTNSNCTSAVAGSGNDAGYASPGITVTVVDNSSTTFFATATNEAGPSACSAAGLTYIEGSGGAPPAPTVTDSDPDSPANDNNPEIKGSALAGSTVTLYTNGTCTGTVAGLGAAAGFATPGITVTVPDNSTTTFFAKATNGVGPSPCSATGLTYSEVTPPTVTPPPAVTPPVATENPECAALRSKLKKAKSKKQKKKIRKKLKALGC